MYGLLVWVPSSLRRGELQTRPRQTQICEGAGADGALGGWQACGSGAWDY